MASHLLASACADLRAGPAAGLRPSASNATYSLSSKPVNQRRRASFDGVNISSASKNSSFYKGASRMSLTLPSQAVPEASPSVPAAPNTPVCLQTPSPSNSLNRSAGPKSAGAKTGRSGTATSALGGMGGMLGGLFGGGDPAEKTRQQYADRVVEVNKLEPVMQKMTDDQLRAMTVDLKKRIAAGESLDSALPEAFAVVREAAKRVLGLRPFDVQLIGCYYSSSPRTPSLSAYPLPLRVPPPSPRTPSLSAYPLPLRVPPSVPRPFSPNPCPSPPGGTVLHKGQIAEISSREGKTRVAVPPPTSTHPAPPSFSSFTPPLPHPSPPSPPRPLPFPPPGGMVLHKGQIAEMRTGEGKTLVAVLPAYLNALTGRGVHVVTVNDYLARRDAEWVGQVHKFLGLSVGLIQRACTWSQSTIIRPGEVRDGWGRAGPAAGQKKKRWGRAGPAAGQKKKRLNPLLLLHTTPLSFPPYPLPLSPLPPFPPFPPFPRSPFSPFSPFSPLSPFPLPPPPSPPPFPLPHFPVPLPPPPFHVVTAEGMDAQQRRESYACDVTYVTNSELGFDFLRDNLATVSPCLATTKDELVLPDFHYCVIDKTKDELVLPDFHYCVIDEVDSILIDEARTPLIISGPAEKPSERYYKAAKLANAFVRDVHYTVDEKQKAVLLTEEGYEEEEALQGVDEKQKAVLLTEEGYEEAETLLGVSDLLSYSPPPTLPNPSPNPPPSLWQVDEKQKAVLLTEEGYEEAETLLGVSDLLSYSPPPTLPNPSQKPPPSLWQVDEKQKAVLLTEEGYEEAETLLGVSDLYDPREQWASYVINAIKAKELFLRDVQYIVKAGGILIVDEFTGRIMEGRRWSEGLHQAVEAKEGLTIQNETVTLASISYQNFFLQYPKLCGMTGTAATEAAEFTSIYKLTVTEIPTNRPAGRKDESDVVFRAADGKWRAVVVEVEVEASCTLRTPCPSPSFPPFCSSPLLIPVAHPRCSSLPFNSSHQDESDVVFRAADGKWRAVVVEVARMNKMGRPVLVGTTSVELSEGLSARLKEAGVKHQVLNAKPENVEREAEIVAQSGRLGAVTIATNMAGRGTDILLGGNAEFMARLKLREMLMPRVAQASDNEIAFEGKRKIPVKKTWAVNPELYPCQLSDATSALLTTAVEAAVASWGANSLPALEAEDRLAFAWPHQRPSDWSPALRAAFQAMDDEYRVFTEAEKHKGPTSYPVIAALRAPFQAMDDEYRGFTEAEKQKGPTSDPVIAALRAAFQAMDDEYRVFTEAEKQKVIAAGGLHVVGTERHESRRIDNQRFAVASALRGRSGRQGNPGSSFRILKNRPSLPPPPPRLRIALQLRGRSGRQGDPGSSRFFLSLEDNIFRIFGGDRIQGLMKAFRVEDMPIESKMLTKALDEAQRKVENYFFDIRKQLFEYDQVLNSQRDRVYAERRRALVAESLEGAMIEYAELTMDDILEANIDATKPKEEWNLEALAAKVKQYCYLLADLSPESLAPHADSIDSLREYLRKRGREVYYQKREEVEKIVPGLMKDAERYFVLSQTDNLWKEHLQALKFAQQAVGLRGYAQKDPLIEYKLEGYNLFLSMMAQIRRNVIYSVYQFKPVMAKQPDLVNVANGVLTVFFLLAVAPVAARGCYLVRSATIDKGKDSGGWRGGGLNPWSEWRMRVWKKPELRVGDTLGKDGGGGWGGGGGGLSEWRMRVPKKPVLRVGDILVFKWRGFLNDVAITVDKKQIDTCNITVAFLLHQTTWSGRYKLLIPKDT
ncbi:unnamed protein product [Closterium sp. NIES-64]|nr:unnamed protein product [Closterium sp. NIES-64]